MGMGLVQPIRQTVQQRHLRLTPCRTDKPLIVADRANA
jgi:hypothetical protein